MSTTQTKKYYHFEDDLKAFPDAWCFIVYSPRGPGKTYSSLKYSLENDITIVYMKRTNDDVDFICNGKSDYDTSPYYPINRDTGSCVAAKLIDNGIGGFWIPEDDGTINGLPISYCLSFNAIKRIKGMDLSRCAWMIFDEFIPQIGERVNRREGDLLLDVYMTINRDRQKRGLPPLILVLFANAEEISTPVTNTLEVVDLMADLNASGKTHYYDEQRGIVIHHITRDEIPLEESEKKGIYQAMANTAWGEKSFGGEFSNNDFTNIQRQSIKGMRGYIKLHYKTHDYYIYQGDKGYYMCKIPTKCIYEYNLNRENEQKAFYYEHQIDLWNECVEERFKFQTYSMYDLIMNFTKFFSVRRS